VNMIEATAQGKVVQVISSTFDAEFPEESIPPIYNALRVDTDFNDIKLHLTGEVQQHLGGGRVRCVALGSTDGLYRGAPVSDTGGPVKMPVGPGVLGRVLNLLGEPIDNLGAVQADEYRSIHAAPPPFDMLTPKSELFETGIKVIDLLAPFVPAERPGCSAGPGWERPLSSRNSSRAWPPSTAATASLPASASGPGRATTSGWKCRTPKSAPRGRSSSTRRPWSSDR